MYHPPPQKSVGQRPCAWSHAPSRRTRSPVGPPVGRAWVGPGEVRVMAERPPVGRLPGPGQPEPLVVLPGLRVRRPDQRRDREASGPALLERREGSPDTVVERSFDVARDHCVPFRSRGRHHATDTRFGALPRVRRAPAVGLVAGAAALPRLVALAIERDAILEEYVEKSDTFARTLVSSGTFGFLPDVPSAYTQPLYAWFLAALYWPLERSWVVVGLAQVVVAVATALLVLAIGSHLATVRTGVIAALVATLHPYLVWHDVHVNREILDGLLAAAMVLLALLAYERRSLLLAIATGGVDGARDPLERTPPAAAPGPRAVRRVACATRAPRGRGGAPRRRRRRGGDRAVGRPQPGRDRVRDDHDGHARALEGEQPGDVRRPRRRRLDRRRARPAGGAALAREGGRDLGRRREGGRRVRPGVVLPRRGHRLLARPARREGAARRPGSRDALVTVPERRRRRPGAAGPVRHSAAHGRAGVRPRPLRARALGRVPRTAPFRGAGGARAGLQHACGDGLRRDGPLPRAVGLRARAARRVRARARLGAPSRAAASRPPSSAAR